MAETIEMTLDGRAVRVDATPETPLLYVIRNEAGRLGPKFGCGLAQCGACTVHLDGQAIRSCATPVAAARGAQVRTLEGLAPGAGGGGAGRAGAGRRRAGGGGGGGRRGGGGGGGGGFSPPTGGIMTAAALL